VTVLRLVSSVGHLDFLIGLLWQARALLHHGSEGSSFPSVLLPREDRRPHAVIRTIGLHNYFSAGCTDHCSASLASLAFPIIKGATILLA